MSDVNHQCDLNALAPLNTIRIQNNGHEIFAKHVSYEMDKFSTDMYNLQICPSGDMAFKINSVKRNHFKQLKTYKNTRQKAIVDNSNDNYYKAIHTF
ncbi:hypothetical protein L2E82_48533 [Cichorium intybus]|uniref:Uncharacterized protein n=1 Tax=Cichorium intybus TaxID=13427 RepID=A0ACB8Z2J7_CICIN|nr:hypothetical protein L2E82_48533 [Cichorium intybus]